MQHSPSCRRGWSRRARTPRQADAGVVGGLQHKLVWCFWLRVVVSTVGISTRERGGYDARLVVRPTAKPSVTGTKMESAGEVKT